MNPSTASSFRFSPNHARRTFKLFAISGLSIGAAAVNAQSTVSISGAIDTGLAYVTTDQSSRFQTANGSIAASSLAFSGKEDLGGGYYAAFMLRSLFVSSTGAISGTKFFGSESKVGLGGPFGQVELGRLFSPTHQTLVFKSPSQSNFAGAFNLAIGAPGAFNAATAGYSPYWDNSVRYTSPAFGGVNVLVQRSTGILDPEPQAPNKKNGIGTALGMNFDNGPISLSGVLEKVSTQALPATDYSVTRGTLMGTYDFGFTKAHAGYINEKYTGSGRPLGFNLMIFGASVPLTPVFKVSVEYGQKRFENAAGKANFVGLGAFYSLSKRTTLFTEVTDIGNHGVARQAVYRGLPTLAGKDTTGYAIGMRHSF